MRTPILKIEGFGFLKHPYKEEMTQVIVLLLPDVLVIFFSLV